MFAASQAGVSNAAILYCAKYGVFHSLNMDLARQHNFEFRTV